VVAGLQIVVAEGCGTDQGPFMETGKVEKVRGAGGEPAGWADGGGAGVPDGVLARVDPEGRTGRGGYGGINCR
jgi:hypothetical protein